jgi:hypothetical protein
MQNNLACHPIKQTASKLFQPPETNNRILNMQQKQMIEHLKGNFESMHKQGQVMKQFTERNVFSNQQSMNNQDSIAPNKFQQQMQQIPGNKSGGIVYSRSQMNPKLLANDVHSRPLIQNGNRISNI